MVLERLRYFRVLDICFGDVLVKHCFLLFEGKKVALFRFFEFFSVIF